MGVRLIKISVIYFLIGVGIGYYMSTAHAYNLTPVHAHVNLLGWTALTLAGIIYILFPAAGKTKLATWHFWLHNIGLPLMMVGLAFVVYGNESLLILTIIGANLTTLAIVLFVINVLKNVKQPESE
ncbi:cytochrome-c oxidase [Sutcliffiella horikoshii]|uniref:Cytochrome-c oxidase n=1 Tax=Sutcliffiella horikoshii TaxID=79883 RepID=A0A1Y0CL14_9BACI|nr:cytochrome-c oxidase [Sutcliffiella horikoshii]ART75979.1 cytochrome-c oxidase [Sutcliffiella horikoshii]TYS73524.1 cytochrome-c oxidase [Sutcliffiella horikoshii]